MFSANASAAAAKSLEFVGSVSSTASTIDISSLVASGRLAVLLDHSYNNSTTIPTSVVPSGFTSVTDQGATFFGGVSIRHIVSFKILSGSEGTLTGVSASTNSKVCAVFKFSSGSIGTVQSGGLSQDILGSEIPQQTISLSGRVSPLILIGSIGRISNTNYFNNLSPTDTPRLPDTTFASALFYKIVNSGSQPTATMTSGNVGAQAMTSFYLNVS